MTITTARTTARLSARTIAALSNASFACTVALAAAAGIGAFGAGSTAQAEHVVYEIDKLGFGDTMHTKSGGVRTITGLKMNDVGNVIGNQTRYNGGATSLGQSAFIFANGSLAQIGLVEAENVKQDDSKAQSSTVSQLNALGQAAGTSKRYHPTTFADNGTAVWKYHDGQTTRIGLFDNEYNRASDGFQSSRFKQLNDLGQVVGNSDRYNGASTFGQAAWFFDAGSTSRIGFTDAEHTRDDTLQNSTVEFLNAQGAAAGTSNRYSGALGAGQSAWIQNGGSITRIGLTSGEHQATNGTRSSTVQILNETGGAVGTSTRYNGNASNGTSAYLVTAETSNRIGLTSAEHTGTGGVQNSQASKLNDEGFAIGLSTRYKATGGDPNGQSAWVARTTSTERIGFFNDEHTGAGGFQSSQAQLLNAVGNVAGISNRYRTSDRAAMGQSAWLNQVGTQRIGLAGGEHARADGFEFSDVTKLNDAGQAIGQSQRYAGQAAIGFTAYIHKDGQSKPMGLYDDQHTRPGDDFQFSIGRHLNEAGQVAGTSIRYNQDANAETVVLGQSGWFYDDELDETHELVFSTRDDGFASTTVNFLSDTGRAIGLYTLYEGAVAIGDRAFLWDFNLTDDSTTPQDERFHDLSDLVQGDELAEEQWAFLRSAAEMSELGHILGTGVRTATDGGESLPFLMTPVPEPTGIALIAMTGLALLPRRRRA